MAYVVIEQLQQLYDVASLSTEFDEIPADVDVLMIVHPQNLSPTRRFSPSTSSC